MGGIVPPPDIPKLKELGVAEVPVRWRGSVSRRGTGSPCGPRTGPSFVEIMLKLGHPWTDGRPPVVKTSATTGEGIDHLVAAVQRRRDWATRCGEAERRTAVVARQIDPYDAVDALLFR